MAAALGRGAAAAGLPLLLRLMRRALEVRLRRSTMRAVDAAPTNKCRDATTEFTGLARGVCRWRPFVGRILTTGRRASYPALRRSEAALKLHIRLGALAMHAAPGGLIRASQVKKTVGRGGLGAASRTLARQTPPESSATAAPAAVIHITQRERIALGDVVRALRRRVCGGPPRRPPQA